MRFISDHSIPVESTGIDLGFALCTGETMAMGIRRTMELGRITPLA